MIDPQQVTAAVLAVLQAGPDQVRYQTAPANPPAIYGVLERPPGTSHDGTMDRPHAELLYRCRIRAVAVDRSPDVAAEAAEATGHRLAVLLLDYSTPITGPGWAVTGRRHEADAGVDTEGTLANHIADYELYVAPAASPSP